MTTSPANRKTTVTLDPNKERILSMQVGDTTVPPAPDELFPITYEYVLPIVDPTNAGKLKTVTVGGRQTTWMYNGNGFVSSVASPTGTVTYTERDALGRPKKVTLPGLRFVEYTYDANGNVLTVKPPDRPVHTFTPNNADLLASYLPPPPVVGGVATPTSYGYDKDRLGLTETTLPVTTTSSYDAAGRRTRLSDGTRTLSFGYGDGHGHMTSANVVAGGTPVSLSREYEQSLLMRETQTIDAGVPRTLDRSYDNLMRVEKLKVAGGPEVVFQFDADGLVKDVGALAVEWTMNGGLLKKLTLTPTVETFTYDGWGAPLTMTMSTGGSLTLVYDSATGRISGKNEAWTFPTLVPKNYLYSYNLAGRLSQVAGDGTPRLYDYDLNGNRQDGTDVDLQDRVLLQGSVSYTYNQANGAVATRTTGGITKTFVYDNAGNLMSVGNVTYVVDALNRRVGKKVNNLLAREWLYDGQLRVVGELALNTAGVVTATRVYGYLPGRHLPVMMMDKVDATTTTYRIVGDHLGSLRAVLKSDGTVMQTMQHDEWGKVLSGSETLAGGFERVPFGFAGGLYDTETGLVRFGARDYDPETGRWLSKDLARFGGGWNFYEYANSNPVNWVDWSGRRPLSTFCGLLGIFCSESHTGGYRDPAPPVPPAEDCEAIYWETYKECMTSLLSPGVSACLERAAKAEKECHERNNNPTMCVVPLLILPIFTPLFAPSMPTLSPVPVF